MPTLQIFFSGEYFFLPPVDAGIQHSKALLRTTHYQPSTHKNNEMKKLSLILVTTLLAMTVSAQFVAKMEVKENIPGICDKNEVYVLFPSFQGQQEAVCPITKDAILEKLNSEVTFLKDNPKYKDKGMIGLVINCRGEVVQCKMDNKTKTPELDRQIEVVFNSLGSWKAGKLNGKEVDTSVLYSFQIKKGVLTFD